MKSDQALQFGKYHDRIAMVLLLWRKNKFLSLRRDNSYEKTQIFGALLVGLLSVVAQIAVFYVRFGTWNAYSTVLDYILFFGAGTLGGLILIYFLNRQNSKTAWFATLLAFLLASPIALVMMAGGGLLGSVGVLVYPQIPWTLFAWLGGLVGNFLAKK